VRRFFAVLLVLILLAAAWPAGLAWWTNSKLQRIDALAPGGQDSGRTYLVAGSDRRGSGGVNDSTSGERADTIVLIHIAENGRGFLISIPRDTYVEIDGHGGQKINAAYAFGGPELLVSTVQQLTGMHIDHYAELGFGSVTELVDAVGGVELCYDSNVDDRDSKLRWTAGCHLSDGTQALAFSRMRKADPLGDIGRGLRQRQVISAVMGKAIEPSLLWHPEHQLDLARAGTEALQVDQATNIFSLGRMMLDLRNAAGPNGVQGAPSIASLNYQPGGIGSAVLLDAEKSAEDFRQILEGTWAGN
jgi:LCP family protein required for cell wall assembly